MKGQQSSHFQQEGSPSFLQGEISEDSADPEPVAHYKRSSKQEWRDSMMMKIGGEQFQHIFQQPKDQDSAVKGEDVLEDKGKVKGKNTKNIGELITRLKEFSP